MITAVNHVIQRRHNNQAVFAADDDYQYYFDPLWKWIEQLGCRVYV
ncbi:MAG: hypothetical protein OET79_14885 [Nitrospirota bacterium]|nr:hypothetical protein [Nitrospirota bacterium]